MLFIVLLVCVLRLLGRDLNLFLGCVFYVLALNLEGILWGFFGITHPWIEKKWPCTGGRALVGLQ